MTVQLYAVVAAAGVLPPGLELVTHEELAGVVGPVQLPGAGDGGARSFDDLVVLSEAVRRHEQVLDRLLARGSVVPFRFGTAAPSRSAVARMLEENAESLRAALASVGGRVEWAVRLRLDPDADYGCQDEPETDADGAPGRRYLAARRRQRDRATLTARLGTACAAAVGEELASVAAGLATTASARWAAADPDDRPTRPLAEWAALVDVADDHRFFTTLRQAVERHGHGVVRAEVTGPWPPYHFVSAFGPSAIGAGSVVS